MAIAARNLIGDLRDMKHDKKTFPVVFGETASMMTASLLKISACGILYATFGTLLVAAPLLLESAIGLFYKHHQNMHRISVVGISVTLANVILANLNLMEATILVNLVYLSSLVGTVFYNKVARASNQDYA
jgi:4-hydroxybenzoate polyprenyltransferase